MNFFYDIILNWSEDNAYLFYEWCDTDPLELTKKIPLVKIKHKAFLDIASNKIRVDGEFLNLIKDKTIISGRSIVNDVKYACLFTDNKNVRAIEFNQEGESVSFSNLLIDDELNVLEVAYDIKETPFNYEIISKNLSSKVLRQELDAKKLINLEINSLYDNKDFAKLRYLYYEYKKETLDNIEEIYNNIKDSIDNNFNEDILKLYYIIKLSYHNV